MTGDEHRDETDAKVNEALDAMDRVTYAIEGLGDYVIQSSEVRKHTGRYRVNLLWIHAIFGLVLAPLFAATPPEALRQAAFSWLVKIPGTPWVEAWVLWLGGMILGFGCIFRAKRTEAVGLILLAAFYLCITFCFAAAAVAGFYGTGPKTTFYAPIVYLHFAVIMGLHVYGVLISERDDRKFATLRGE